MTNEKIVTENVQSKKGKNKTGPLGTILMIISFIIILYEAFTTILLLLNISIGGLLSFLLLILLAYGILSAGGTNFIGYTSGGDVIYGEVFDHES